MAKSRKRTGAHKRQMQRKLGTPAMPDESRVKSPQTATTFLLEWARAELATGFSLRVEPAEDIAAYPHIDAAAHEHGRELAQRLLSPHLVAGVQPIVKQLQDIVLLATAAEEETEGSPDQLMVARAAKFAGARRRAIARLYKGEKNRALRHAFGISQRMKFTSADEVSRAVLALLSGRAEQPGSAAARLVSAADVKTAKAFVAQLAEMKTRNGARRTTNAETARVRDVLHAALELFYDRFAAAVDVAFEGNDEKRVSLLSLIPRRKEARKTSVKQPVAVVPPVTVTPPVASASSRMS